MGKYDAQRKISFKKPNPSASLGISLAGGNATGIFVHNIEEDSPAAGHNGVHPGDQILEVLRYVYFIHLCLICKKIAMKLVKRT